MQLQMIFDAISEKQIERRQYEENYKTALKNHDAYQLLLEQLEELKTKKSAYEMQIKSDLGNVIDKLEDAKTEIKGKKEMLSDVALNMLMSGETVGVKDNRGNEYEPVWSVKFKKKEKVFKDGKLQ
jgi:seryl-tRNA synthetase